MHLKSKTFLPLSLYVKPFKVLNISNRFLLRLYQSPYKVPEAESHCFNTYCGHHASNPSMKAALMTLALYTRFIFDFAAKILKIRVD